MAEGDAEPETLRGVRRRADGVRAGRRLRLARAAGGDRARAGVHARRPRPAAGHLLGRRADAGIADPGAGRRARTCCCSTSRPTTSTSTPSSGSRSTSTASTPTVVFVSHDRWFLESVATAVLELERGQGAADEGQLLALATRRRPSGWRGRPTPYERQQEELAHLQRFVDRFRYGTQVPPGAEQAEGDGADRAGRAADASSRSLKFGFPPPAAERADRARGRGAGRRGGRPHAGRRRRLRHRAGPARGADRPQRRRQDDADRDAAGARGRPAGRVKLGPQRRPSPTTPSSRSSCPSTCGWWTRWSQGTKLTGPQARDAARAVPVLGRAGREAGGGALGRRAAAARAGCAWSCPARTSWCSTSRPTTSTSRAARRWRTR